MSQAGSPSVYRSPGVNVSQTNGLGLAGFIVSLVGLVVTGGFLCPVGVLLSGIALFKPPRAFAVAGLILGLIGSALAVMIVLMMAGLIAGGLFAASNFGLSPSFYAESTITSHASMQGTLPDEATGNNLLQYDYDEWGTPFRYRPIGTTDFELISAGPDMQHGTGDDVVTTHVAYFGGPHGHGMGQPYTTQSDPAFARAEAILQVHFSGTPLTDEQGQAAIDGITDRFGTQLRYRIIFDNNYFIESAGPDRTWDTDDDPDPFVGALENQ